MNASLDWVEQLWEQVNDQLYDPKMGLIYDYVTSREPGKRFAHLPKAEEIARAFPNPCGWGTGMEDCALNTGLMLAWLAESDDVDDPLGMTFGLSLEQGLWRCLVEHENCGFLARGLTPGDDDECCYPNSSRDQYTLAVYGMWRWRRACQEADCLDPDDDRSREFLCAIADYCAAKVTPANGYSLLRRDGRAAAASKMWDCAPHEMLRLPMIYGAAWDASGDPRYRDLMDACLVEGLRRTLAADPESPDWWDMPLLQMQCSLSFFLESGVAPQHADAVRQGMRLAAGVAGRLFMPLLDEMESYPGPWDALYDDWRQLPLWEQRVALDGPAATAGEAVYPNPRFAETYAKPNRMLRAAGDLLATIGLSQDVPHAFLDVVPRLDAILSRIDLTRCAGAGTVPLLFGATLVEGRINDAIMALAAVARPPQKREKKKTARKAAKAQKKRKKK